MENRIFKLEPIDKYWIFFDANNKPIEIIYNELQGILRRKE